MIRHSSDLSGWTRIIQKAGARHREEQQRACAEMLSLLPAYARDLRTRDDRAVLTEYVHHEHLSRNTTSGLHAAHAEYADAACAEVLRRMERQRSENPPRRRDAKRTPTRPPRRPARAGSSR